MAISVFLKAFTRRAQLRSSLSSYESVSSLTILGFIRKPCFDVVNLLQTYNMNHDPSVSRLPKALNRFLQSPSFKNPTKLLVLVPMAISVFLKAFARRPQLPSSLSSYESVFRNVSSPGTSSLLGKQFTSLGSWAYCSKAYHGHSYPVEQNQTKSNLKKVVFKYACTNDESQEHSRPVKPVVKKVLEIPSGHTFFEYREGDIVGWCNLSEFLHSYLVKVKEATESASGDRFAEFCFVEASLFKERIGNIMDSAADAFFMKCMIDNIEKTEDSFPDGKNTRCGLKLYLDDIFKIRIWEIITGGDKHVLDIIVSELKKNGFDFTEDPEKLQKIEEAVERAMTRMTNGIKLHLPVPAGEPDMSATISWGKYTGPPVLKSICVAPRYAAVRLCG